MCGSDQNLDAEYKDADDRWKLIHEDGQLHIPSDDLWTAQRNPCPLTNSLLVFTMFNHYAQDGNPRGKEWIDLLRGGRRADAIQVEDRAYYPVQAGSTQAPGALRMTPPSAERPYHPPDEPLYDQQGAESVKFDEVRNALSGITN